MKRTGFALLTLIVPVLCALDIEQDTSCVPSAEPAMSCAEDQKAPFDERTALRQYVRDLDPQCDDQVEYLATVIPIGRVDALRKEHYEWRLQRDLQCAETGRKSPDELAELRCLSKLTGDYFDRREVEIVNIEDERAKKLGIEKPESDEKLLPGIP